MKAIFTVLFLLFLGTETWAQLEVAFSYGYRFGGRLPVRVDNQFGDLRVNESDAFTGDLRYRAGGTTITASYTRQSSSVDFVGRSFLERERLFSTTVEYITVGGCRGAYSELGFNPFGCLGVGVGILTPQNTDLRNEVRLGANLSGGFNYFFTEKVGLRMSLGILTPFQFGSAGLFCGGGGCSVGVGASSQIVQGDISGGVVVRLGGDSKPAQQPRQPSQNMSW